MEKRKEIEDLSEEVIAPVNTLIDVIEKDRKILGRLCQAVGRWESEEKEGKGPWAFHTREVSGLHEAQAQAQGEARQAQPGHCAAVPGASASPLPGHCAAVVHFCCPFLPPSLPSPFGRSPCPSCNGVGATHGADHRWRQWSPRSTDSRKRACGIREPATGL